MRASITKVIGFALLGIAGSSALAAAEGMLSFSPLCKVQAEVVAKGPEVTVTVKKNGEAATETILMETEQPLKLAVDDFNFDGHADFSITHLDDGMGTYFISEVYVYSVKEKKFVRLAPKCGSQFVTLVVLKKKRTLTSTYWDQNRHKTCTMKF